MVDLEQEIRSLSPERSLLMCYSASLLHFEFFLLDALQQEGAGQVSLLVDPRSYETSFAEGAAVRGPGLDYRFAAVHLPSARSAFHPKLYAFSSEDRITLLVASANLTLHGCRKNLEIIDRLEARRDGSGDRGALGAYADYLEGLLILDPGLHPAVRDDVEEAIREIRSLPTPPVAGAKSRPRFLHTLGSSLLSQVQQIIDPPDRVREITLFSSSFDARGQAASAIAASYPNATLRIIARDGARTSIDGTALARIGSRLSLHPFAMDGKENRDRLLHAKVAIFRTDDESWLISGSANLSEPAWLKAAMDGGNVEAVTIRHASTADAFDGLLEPIVPTEPVSLTSLQWIRSDETHEGPPPPFTVREARLSSQWIEVRIHAQAKEWQQAAFRAVMSEEEEPLQLIEITPGDPLLRSFRAEVRTDAVMDESASAVRIEGETTAGERYVSRVWLDRPQQLTQDASERAFRRAVRSMERRGRMTEAGDLLQVSELLFRLASRIAAPDQEGGLDVPSSPASQADTNDRSGQAEAPARRITGITMGEGGSSRAGGQSSEAVSLLERIIQALRRAWRGQNAEEEEGDLPAGAGEEGEAARDRQDAEITAENRLGPALEFPRVRPADLKTMQTRLKDAAERLFEREIGPDSVAATARHLEALVEFFVHLRGIVSQDKEATGSVMVHLSEILESAFSLDGFGFGRARGWFVRAWMEPSSRELSTALWRDPSRSAAIACVIGMVAARLETSGQRHAGRMQNVVTGFRVISGTTDPEMDPEWIRRISEIARVMAQLPDSPDADRITGALVTPVVMPPQFTKTVGEYAALLGLQGSHAPIPGAPDPSTLPDGVRRLFERLHARRPPAVVPVAPMGDSVGCQLCNVALPLEAAQNAMTGSAVVQCTTCGRMLAPFDLEHEGVPEIIGLLLSAGNGGPS